MQDFVGGAAPPSTVRSRSEAEPLPHRSRGFDEPILRLLLNGAPDKAIAARLQVSERTVQRHVRILLTKVGAHNRMQLGQILARRARHSAESRAEGRTEAAEAAASASLSGCGSAAGAPAAPAHQHRLTDFDSQVLTRLLHGVPESAIAEALCVSRRTVQRSVKGLMTRAGAANRVQLGWYAQRNGWI